MCSAQVNTLGWSAKVGGTGAVCEGGNDLLLEVDCFLCQHKFCVSRKFCQEGDKANGKIVVYKFCCYLFANGSDQ